MKNKKVNLVKGFTLLELVVVMVVLIIISFIVSPSLLKFQREQSVKNTTENVIAILNKAKSDSSSSLNSSSYGVHFDTHSATYFIGDTFSEGASGNETVDFEPGTSIPSFWGINLNGGGDDVVFPRLSRDVIGYGTLIIQLDADTTRQIVITVSKVGAISSNE